MDVEDSRISLGGLRRFLPGLACPELDGDLQTIVRSLLNQNSVTNAPTIPKLHNLMFGVL